MNNTIYANGAYGGAILNDVGSNLTIIDSNFTDNSINNTSGCLGGAITNSGNLNIITSTFTNNTATGTVCGGGGAIYNMIGNLTVLKCSFTNNKATTGTTGNDSGGGAVYNAQGIVTINSSTFNSNTANGTNGHDNGGGAITNYMSGSLNVTNSTFINNKAVGANFYGGAIYNSYGAISEIHFNEFYGNVAFNGSDINCFSGSIDARYNWWGSNSNPSGKVSGNVDINNWLVLNTNATPTIIPVNGISTITADLTHDQNGVYYDPANGHVPDSIAIYFSSTLGSLNLVTTTLTNGVARTTFTAGSKPGLATVNTIVDSQTINSQLTIERDNVYVSPVGDDTTGDGSQSNPFKTIGTGIAGVYPGGTVHISIGTYTGTNNKNIIINKNVKIVGSDATSTIVDVQNVGRIFTITNGANVIINNLTLENANAVGNGGAINNAGILTLTDTNLQNNTASGSGGTIYNTGTATINFNRIIGTGTIITSYSGTVNAANNWWGIKFRSFRKSFWYNCF